MWNHLGHWAWAGCACGGLCEWLIEVGAPINVNGMRSRHRSWNTWTSAKSWFCISSLSASWLLMQFQQPDSGSCPMPSPPGWNASPWTVRQENLDAFIILLPVRHFATAVTKVANTAAVLHKVSKCPNVFLSPKHVSVKQHWPKQQFLDLKGVWKSCT